LAVPLQYGFDMAKEPHMKRWMHWIFLGLLLTVVPAHADPVLTLVRTISLPNVAGRIDHLAIDKLERRLFVAALGNHSVEVIDLQAGKFVRHLAGFSEPQGVAYLPDLKRLVVADGGADRVDILDGQSFRLLHRIDGLDDADNVRFEVKSGRVYGGYGNGGLQVLDPKNGAMQDKIALSGHPEAFEIDEQRNRIFINVPEKQQIIIAERQGSHATRMRQLATAERNFPMALDTRGHHLFVGTRRPALLQVYNADSGNPVSRIAIGADPDDIFFDSATKRLYVVCGEGVINVLRQTDADHFTMETTMPTRAGARTGLFVPEKHRLYVAVPQRNAQSAEIREFAVSP
jgi:DNA-binding beta-propeller fold protein YncE